MNSKRVLPLLVALVIGMVAVVHLPLIDDEANAIVLAIGGKAAILQAGLGVGGHFHPPLSDLLQSSWFALVKPQPIWLARLPALFWWLSVCALVPWSFAPLLKPEERERAQWAVVLFPVHWVFPFIATWYSLAAFLIVLATGAFLRVLDASASGRGRALMVLWVLAVVTLGYTVFAWPAVLLAHAWLALRTRERAAWWPTARNLLPALVCIVLGLGPTLLVILDRMSYAVRGRAGGGGFMPVGAMAALLAGPTAPSSIPVLVAAASCTGVGALVLLRAARPAVRTLFGAGCAVIVTLLLTRTLADKRLLLCSVFVAAALGAATCSAARRMPSLCLVVGALPALFGWWFPQSAPLVFPRWADPHQQIAATHCATSEPRLLVGDQAALVLTAGALCGDVTRVEDRDEPISLAWDSATVLYQAQELRTRDPGRPSVVTVDLVAFLDYPDSWLANAVADLRVLGFEVSMDQYLGEDAFARLRDDQARDRGRYHWVRLSSRR